jgi:galactose mutarotase-like enzyme
MTDDLIQISNDHLSVTVSALGAEMQSLQDAEGRDYLWNGDAEYWTGRAPILFPIVGRAPGDQIRVGDHTAPMAQHGFARRSRFALLHADQTTCTHVLTPTEAIRAVYPPDFRLELTHSLNANALTVNATVTNPGTDPLPFGLGYHPAFRWPLPGAEDQPHHVTLVDGSAPDMARLQDGLLPPTRQPSPFEKGRLELDQSLFEADAMLFPNAGVPGLDYGPDQGPRLTFAFENLPDLALWTKPGAPFLCIEPWHGTAARTTDGPAIEDRPNAILLPPKNKETFKLEIKILCADTGTR